MAGAWARAGSTQIVAHPQRRGILLVRLAQVQVRQLQDAEGARAAKLKGRSAVAVQEDQREHRHSAPHVPLL